MSKKAAIMLMVGLTLLPGCIMRSPLKKDITLPALSEYADFVSEPSSDGLTVQAHLLSKKETKKLLGTVIQDTNVIQITVTNNTPITYILKKHTIDIEMLPIHVVARILKRRGAFFKDIALTATLSAIAVPSFVGYIAGCVRGSSAIALTSLVGGIGAAAVGGKAISRCAKQAYKRTHTVLRQLSPDSLWVPASKTNSMLVFVDSCYVPDSFNLSMYAADAQKTAHHFTITL